MYKLKTIGTPFKQFTLKTGAYRLGSAPDSELVLEDSSVSDYHCEIVVTSQITVRDLSPTHETFIDEEPVRNARLEVGQILRLGNVMLSLEAEGVPAGAVSAPEKVASNAVSSAKPKSRLFDTLGVPLLLLFGLSGLAVLVYYAPKFSSQDDPDAPTAPEEAQKPEGKKSAKEPDKEKHPGKSPESAVGQNAGSGHHDSKAGNSSEGTRLSASGTGPSHHALTPEVPGTSTPLLPSGVSSQIENSSEVQDLRKLLAKQQSELGPSHPEVAKTLNNLANRFEEAGQFKKAEPYLRQALSNLEESRGETHPDTAAAANKLASTLAAAGDNAKAEALLEDSISARADSTEPGDRQLAVSLHNLAALKAARGDHKAAKPLLERALKELGQSSKPNDPMIPDTLKDLASLHDAEGDKEGAERFAKAAAKVAEAIHGTGHPKTAEALSDLAKLQQKHGDEGKAASALERAAESSSKALGSGHPQTEENLDSLARINICKGDPDIARETALKALESKRELLSRALAAASESQWLEYRARLNPNSLAVFAQAVPDLALTVLQNKGTVLDALLGQGLLVAQGISPDAKLIAEEIRETKAQLAPLLFNIPDGSSTNEMESGTLEKTALTEKLQRLETTFSRFHPGAAHAKQALSTTLEDLQSTLPSQSALIEFIRYSRCSAEGQWEPCYGAVLMPAKMEPVWISLGTADQIERAINEFYRTTRIDAKSDHTKLTSDDPDQVVESSDEKESVKAEPKSAVNPDEGLSKSLKELYGLIWKPLETHIPAGTRDIIISPEGALNVVSFATFLTPEDQFLVSKYAIRYVSSGRDLLVQKAIRQKEAGLILANADFSQVQANGVHNNPTSIGAVGKRDQEDFKKIKLPLLSRSIEEGALIELLLQTRKTPVRSLVGGGASEASLMQAKSPRIVHFATAGFFLPKNPKNFADDEDGAMNQPTNSLRVLRPLENGRLAAIPNNSTEAKRMETHPLHRGGVILAGAKKTLSSWNQGTLLDPSNDGILTASEIGTLDLNGTGLVVLSSSDAGNDPARSGESVLALRRAFIQAGVENLLIVMGAEAEEETSKILKEFYENYLDHGDASRALSEVQQSWLSRLRKDRGLLASVRLAGSLILNSIGSVD